LVAKRDIILTKIRAYLRDKNLPGFELVNQGSYIYGVGVEPIGELEHDIDVGLAFNIKSDDYSAADVRAWVFDAIKGHTNKVDPKGPCIRVHYAAGYHVDLVIYAQRKSSDDREEFQLAHKNGRWLPTDPKRLKQHILDARVAYKDTKANGSADQLQRVVRYLKRWNDEAIPRESEDKPFGLALLLLAINTLAPTLFADGRPDDLSALERVARTAATVFGCIIVKKPTPEYEDVFGKLSQAAMTALKDRFKVLADTLAAARREAEVSKAAELVKGVLGSDFPTPESLQKSVAVYNFDQGIQDRIRSAKVAVIHRSVADVQDAPKPWSCR
jgi:hypothetical protein